MITADAATIVKGRRPVYPARGYNNNTVKASCMNARVVDNSQKFCGFVTWTSAHLYQNYNFSVYTGGVSYTDNEQNDYARSLYNSYLDYYPKLKSDCAAALQRLACMNAFPQCKLSGSTMSSVGYWTPCRLQCEQILAACGYPAACGANCNPRKYPTADCNQYAARDCMIYVPPGYFVIDPNSGPFQPLIAIYAVCMASWFLLAWVWNWLTFVRHARTCVTFCRAVSGIPILKAVVVSFGMAFW